MKKVVDMVRGVAPLDSPVLLMGETGVGKELIARTLHDLSGLPGSFVAVNAAGLDDNVFSDTLFGHVKGAYTGADRDRSGLIEQAAGGTLFLDEVGDMPAEIQPQLLRALQQREIQSVGGTIHNIDLRVISATGRNARPARK